MKKPPGSAGLAACAKSDLQPVRRYRLLPSSLQRLRPSEVAAAGIDLALIWLVLWIASRAAGNGVLLASPTMYLYSLTFVLVAVQAGLYRHGRNQSLQYSALAKAILCATTSSALALKTSPDARLLPLFVLAGLSACVLVAYRGFSESIGKNSNPPRNVLFIGDAYHERQIADAIAKDPGSSRTVKVFLRAKQFRDGDCSASLRTIARKECIDEVIIATRDLDLAEEIFREAQQNQLDVSFLPPFETNFQIESLEQVTLFTLHHQRFPQWQLGAKRLLDIVFASAGLLLVSPLLLLIAFFVIVDSRGPAIYRSVRIGYRGRKFVCYKFRTMVLHSDAAKDWLRTLNERSGAFFKISRDPRITRVGSFLRRYSLDELPQLWNVLRGDMSLVGPRPHPVEDVEGYSAEDLQRLDSVPGMTGLWQVTARQDPSFERCVELDVEYIKRWTPWLDLRILCQTITCVLQGSGV